MRKTFLPMTVALISLAGTAFGAEFQPMGALGMGGAGVARTTNAMAGYWNPAGLAFNEQSFSVPLSVSVGLRVSKGLADNVDKLSDFTKEGPNGEPSALDNLTNINTGVINTEALGDIVSLLSIIKDIETQKGTISLNGNAVVAMQVKHFGFGAFGNMEGFAKPDVDLVNVLPGTETTVGGVTTSTPLTPSEFADLAPPASPASNLFFTDSDIRGQILTSLTANGLSAPQATNLINAIDAQLAATAGTSGLTQEQAADVLTNTLAPALSGGGSIDDNRTSVFLKSLAYVEFPISYGHPISLGKYGQLGVGASLKPIRGRVYSSTLRLVEDEGVDSSDVTDNLTENYEESSSVTFDLGLFYKYSNWLNVGLVAKNLTSPEFDSPELRDQDGALVLVDAKGNPIGRPEKVTLKPQVRVGVSLDPLSWLTIAADLDITDNETVLESLDYKSRNLGGGIELHPFTWFKLRAGMYKNLSNDEVGPVATAGLTFGTKWVNLDLDGAYGLEKTRYDEKDYPKEARAQASLNIQF